MIGILSFINMIENSTSLANVIKFDCFWILKMMLGKTVFEVFSKSIRSKYALSFKSFNRPNKNNQFLIHKSLQYNFSTMNDSLFIFNLEKQPQLLKLQLQYRSLQNISIFQNEIKASTGILDQMNIFKIFKVMEVSTYSHSAYQEFFDFVQNYVKRKSDNMLLLLATVKERMAKQYKEEKNIEQTLISLEQALEILQRCMIPPLLPYYSVYREYGLLQYELGNALKAKEILTQSVQILDDFVSHSDDNVSTNSYCKKQATAYNALASIDVENHKKWVQKANAIWEKYTENKFCELEYAKTIAHNLKKEIKEDKEKGEAYYNFNLYQFQTKEMKEILKKAKEQLGN